MISQQLRVDFKVYLHDAMNLLVISSYCNSQLALAPTDLLKDLKVLIRFTKEVSTSRKATSCYFARLCLIASRSLLIFTIDNVAL
jgi:hypothetical protein